MPRPVTLFTGQWADLPIESICQKASKWGYDGIELPCWGDHLNVQQALSDDKYCQGRHDLLVERPLPQRAAGRVAGKGEEPAPRLRERLTRAHPVARLRVQLDARTGLHRVLLACPARTEPPRGDPDGQRVERVLEAGGHRGRVSEERDPPSRQRRTERRVRQQAVDTELHAA